MEKDKAVIVGQIKQLLSENWHCKIHEKKKETSTKS
jgi:hypothetical protein